MNQIQKSINNENCDYDKFLEKIELIYYDTDYTDDDEVNERMDKIFDDLNDTSEGMDICRGDIDAGYIREVFLEEDIMGYVAKIEGQYVGFILFKKVGGHIYLSLVGTKPKLGMPLGQILIAVMEETAIQSGIGIIQADSVKGALNFYKKNNWQVIEKDEEADTYFIQKQVIKGYVEIIEDPNDDDELCEELFEEFEELQIIDINEGKNAVDRVMEYVYACF